MSPPSDGQPQSRVASVAQIARFRRGENGQVAAKPDLGVLAEKVCEVARSRLPAEELARTPRGEIAKRVAEITIEVLGADRSSLDLLDQRDLVSLNKDDPCTYSHQAFACFPATIEAR